MSRDGTITIDMNRSIADCFDLGETATVRLLTPEETAAAAARDLVNRKNSVNSYLKSTAFLLGTAAVVNALGHKKTAAALAGIGTGFLLSDLVGWSDRPSNPRTRLLGLAAVSLAGAWALRKRHPGGAYFAAGVAVLPGFISILPTA